MNLSDKNQTLIILLLLWFVVSIFEWAEKHIGLILSVIFIGALVYIGYINNKQPPQPPTYNKTGEDYDPEQGYNQA